MAEQSPAAAPPAGKPNRLAGEKSPYLLQHAHNPVDWYPWGEAAFAKARKEDKPIFLSIGYSTCHWCHVMERESFSDARIAAILNEHFVAIKVDREERPDVDSLYMEAVQAMTGSGGWPLSAFLTPDLKPFYGGTYFPPRARWGSPGFEDVLGRVAELWGHDRAKLLKSGDELAKALAQASAPREAGAIPGVSALDSFFESYARGFDSWMKGAAPKFPMPSNQNFLLRYHARAKNEKALELVSRTLKAAARGGIFDQLGGGFHRYSTDANWRVPHFEKMLYDNAQLAVNYIEAYQATKDEEFARVARETLEYLQREMARPGGGFYSAQDADSLPAELAGKVPDEGFERKGEGAFYVWEAAEIEKALGGPAAGLFSYRFGVAPGGNAANDPQGELRNKNILFAAHSVEETAGRSGKSVGEVREALEQGRKKLFDVRAKRPRPLRDDKILTSWNGLAISAFAKAGAVFEDPDFLASAADTAKFLRSRLFDAKTRHLYRRWRDGERKVPGLADDYAFLVQGLLDLYEASLDARWLEWAEELAETQDKLFFDPENGGFFMTAREDSKELLARGKTESDNVEPAASSVAALNLLRLSQYTDREDFRKAAEKTLAAFGGRMKDQPHSVPQMLCALDFHLADAGQIVIAGDPASPDTVEMLRVVRQRFMPNKILMLADGGKGQEALARRLPFLKNVRPIQGKATAYVCAHYACDLPTNDLRVFRQLLDGRRPSRTR